MCMRDLTWCFLSALCVSGSRTSNIHISHRRGAQVDPAVPEETVCACNPHFLGVHTTEHIRLFVCVQEQNFLGLVVERHLEIWKYLLTSKRSVLRFICCTADTDPEHTAH